MSWDVICPHCRGSREEFPSLGNIPARGFCDICLIDFDTSGQNALAITFHVHPSIRTVKKRMFCSAEPATKPHIKVQQTLAPAEVRQVLTSLESGQYRLRQKGVPRMEWLDIEADCTDYELRWKSSAQPPYNRLCVHPDLSLENDSEEIRTFIVEDIRWGVEALRPADLFNLQLFREMFPTETLAPDFYMEVGEQTIVFTDVVNSTGFYLDRGDGEAFLMIREHFRSIYEISERCRGGVIKTIGDSAMMAFADPSNAVQAAREIATLFGPHSAGIRLRLALNTGPCIAVRLNSGIDYFGQTVNLAAKLMRLASAGEIALSESAVSAARNHLLDVPMRSTRLAVATKEIAAFVLEAV